MEIQTASEMENTGMPQPLVIISGHKRKRKNKLFLKMEKTVEKLTNFKERIVEQMDLEMELGLEKCYIIIKPELVSPNQGN